MAFEEIVVPHPDAKGYFPHELLKRPDPSSQQKTNFYAKYEFWPSDAREARAFYSGSAFPDYESTYEKFGQDFADAQYKLVETKNEKFNRYLQSAIENDGILIGDTQLAESDFKIWLSDEGAANVSRTLGMAHAMLSLAGVQIALPNIAPKHIDELHEAKLRYAAEVADYRAFINELLSGAWDLVKTDPTVDALARWATFTAETRIQPALRRLEAAVRTGDRQLLERIGYGLMTDVPNLIAGQLRGSNTSIVATLLEGLLKILAPNLAQSIRERRALEASFGLSYLYRLHKASS
jgi:hypothetical protein